MSNRAFHPQKENMLYSCELRDVYCVRACVLCVCGGRGEGGVILRRLQAKTKIHVDGLREFLFADDCALTAKNEENMPRSMDLLSTACDNFGLTISTKKTEVMHQPMSWKPYQEPTVKVNNQTLTAVDKFAYLGSTLSRSVHIDDETNTPKRSG